MKRAYYEGIEELGSKYAVGWLCGIVGVSRSGYYKWKNRKGKQNRYQQSRRILDHLVSCYHEEHPTLGYRSIRALILHDTGWLVSSLGVHQSMKRQQIRALPRKPRYHYRTAGKEHRVFPNHLDRNFNAGKPNQKIVTDIGSMKNRGKKIFFSLFFDLYNNSIVAAAANDREDNRIVIKPMKLLLEKKSIETPLLLHSDQGAQYSSLGFTSLLKRYNVQQSMSRAGTPHDNAVAESLIGRFKDVLAYEFDFCNTQTPYETFYSAVDFFNNRRPAYALQYKTPAQFTIEQGHAFLVSTNY